MRHQKYLRLKGLSDGSDLVDFEQQAVAGLVRHGFSNALGVGHSEVITHHLDVSAGSEVSPGLPVILVKWILNGDHWETKDGTVLIWAGVKIFLSVCMYIDMYVEF